MSLCSGPGTELCAEFLFDLKFGIVSRKSIIGQITNE
jgi:hypothetical protein